MVDGTVEAQTHFFFGSKFKVILHQPNQFLCSDCIAQVEADTHFFKVSGDSASTGPPNQVWLQAKQIQQRFLCKQYHKPLHTSSINFTFPLK